MRDKNNIFNLLFINTSILFFILIIPSIFLKVYRTINPKQDIRISLPIFKSESKQREIFNELESLDWDYIPYIGWKSRSFKGKHINVENKYRVRKTFNSDLKGSTFFFGGSSMWGFGVADSETLPSHFAKLTNENVINFGVNGYTSRQNLNRLITILNDKELDPKKIYFLSGQNDIEVNCKKSTINIPSHSRSNFINSRISSHEITLATSIFVRRISSPFLSILNIKNNKNQDNLSQYECSENSQKAEKVAKELINNWKIAYIVSKEKGIDIKVILQPHIFGSNEKVSYLDYQNNHQLKYLKKEFDATYPIVKERIISSCNELEDFCDVFIDGSNWLSSTNNIFMDFSHVNSKGNKLLAEKIISNFEKN